MGDGMAHNGEAMVEWRIGNIDGGRLVGLRS